MKARIAKKWSSELRSDKYVQTTGKLAKPKNPEGKLPRCCLGVLCDIHAKETGKRWRKNDGGDPSYMGKDNLLPLEVALWAGIRTPKSARNIKKAKTNGLDPYIGKVKAAHRNDQRGESFETIAKSIDRCAATI